MCLFHLKSHRHVREECIEQAGVCGKPRASPECKAGVAKSVCSVEENIQKAGVAREAESSRGIGS